MWVQATPQSAWFGAIVRTLDRAEEAARGAVRRFPLTVGLKSHGCVDALSRRRTTFQEDKMEMRLY